MSFWKNLFKSRLPADGTFFVQIQKLIGQRPNHADLYHIAFRHSSASERQEGGRPINNQRLEYLGDSVLGMVAAEYLYHHFPQGDEGALTSMRSKLVSRKNLNRIGHNMGLEKLLVSKFHSRKMPQSASGDALEALVGAVYLDLGFEAAKTFILEKVIGPKLDLRELHSKVSSYKSALLEWSQKRKVPVTIQTVDSWGESHNMTFKVQLEVDGLPPLTATGPSKKKAEEKVAKLAYEKIKGKR